VFSGEAMMKAEITYGSTYKERSLKSKFSEGGRTARTLESLKKWGRRNRKGIS